MVEEKTQLDKLKELEMTLAKELDQQVRLTEASDPRLEGSVSVNPNLAGASKKVAATAGTVSTPGKDAGPATGSVSLMGSVTEATPAPSGASALDTASATSPAPHSAPDKGLSSPNPTQTAGASSPSSGGQTEEVSLQDVDSLLTQLDSDFQQSLQSIKAEISESKEINSLESISIGSDYLKQGEKEDASEPETVEEADDELVQEILQEAGPIRASGGLVSALWLFIKNILFFLFRVLARLFTELKRARSTSPKYAITAVLTYAKDLVVQIKDNVIDLFKIATSYKRTTYLQALTLLFLLGAFGILVKDIVSNFRADKEIDPYLRNFHDVSTREVLIPDDQENEDNPFKQPEYVVQMPRIVANLKPHTRRDSPMLAIELYIEAGSQDAAIEVHERQLEIKDAIERIAEETTFEDLDTSVGKGRFKGRVITTLNSLLNKGKVRRLFFKSLNIKQ